jgi:hypothetical protein
MECNHENALAFVEQHGSHLDNSRLEWILRAERPDSKVSEGFTVMQNEDGGFPFGNSKGNPSTVNDTIKALWLMSELGLSKSRGAEQAFQYLVVAQHDNGSWDEHSYVVQYNPPPWIRPGDIKTVMYLSSYATYWFFLRDARDYQVIQKAISFLVDNQDVNGKFRGFLHNTWISTSVLFMAGKEYSGKAEKGLRYLMSRPLSDWLDDQIAWACDCLGTAGLTSDHAFISNAVKELIKRQNSDGSWASESGETHSTGATISVLKAFKKHHIL